jgi:hypothetical protein
VFKLGSTTAAIFRGLRRILPPYLRRTPSLENLIPILYLKGVSSSSMAAALAPLLGSNAAGLSATTIVRLIEGWHLRTTNIIESGFDTSSTQKEVYASRPSYS